MASIQELMEQLGAMNYLSPSSYKGYKHIDTSIDRSMPDVGKYNFSQKDLSGAGKKKKKVDAGINLFDMLSGTIGQPSGFMTTMLSNAMHSGKDIKDKDTPLWKKIMELSPTGIMGKALTQGIKGGAKEQMKDWKDGKLSWGDAGAGFLHGMDKSWTRGSEILEDAGVKNRWGKVGGGIAIDIALDPLTYLTGGLSAASKMGKAAEVSKVTELAKGLGMTKKFKKADDFIEEATNSMKNQMKRKYPNVSEHVIDKTIGKKISELSEQIKTARNTTYNSHVNDWGFGVPFTNKFAKVGTYGKKNLLHNSEALVPQELVKSILSKASLGSHTGKLLEEAVHARYGVNDLSQLSKTMYDDLVKFMDPIIDRIQNGKSLPDSVGTVGKNVDLTSHQAYDFDEALDMLGKKNNKRTTVEEPNILFHGTNKPNSITRNGFQIGKHTEYGDNVFGNGGIYLGHDLNDAWYLGADARMPEYKNILGVHATPKNTLVLKSDKQLKSLIKKYGVKSEYHLDDLAEKLKADGYDAIQIKPKTKDLHANATPEEYAKWADESKKNGDYLLYDRTGGAQTFIMDSAALKNLGSVKKGSKDTAKAIEVFKKKHGLTGTTKTTTALDNMKTPKVTDPMNDVNAFKHQYDTNWTHHLTGTPEANAAKDSRVFTQQFNKMLDNTYNEMGNFKSRFEHGLDKINPFDARTLATGDKFVNSMGDHIADAHSQQVGETARYSMAMDDIKKFVDKIPKADQQKVMNEAIYILENHAPDALGGSKFVPSAQGQQLANKLKPVIDRIGQQESGGGVLDQLRANYFPHVVNHDADKLKDIQDYMKRNGELNGNSSKSSFNKERTSFQTLAQKDNYIAKLEKAIQKETDPDKIKTLQEQQERVANMFDTDVVSALRRRIKTGVRAKAMKDMQGKLSKYGMMKTVKDGSGGPSGFTELSKEEVKRLGLGEGKHYVQPDVIKGLKKVDEIFTAEGMNKFTRTISGIADVWRPLVTYYKPSHYVNNIIGNTINNMAAGVKLRDYRAAGKLLTGYREGKLTEAQMKIIESAYKHNVISGGFLYDAHQTFNFAEPSGLEKAAQKIGNNKVIKKVRHHAGEKPDDISRLANYLNGIDKWGNTERAAKQVRTYLFNYNELTNADRTMRVLVPFWNWTKRNVPLQMKTLMENPKFAMNIERFKQLFNQDKEGATWQKDTGIKVPMTDYYTSLPSPTNDLEMLTSLRPWLGSMTPAAKIPLELSTNQRLFSGSPISYGSDGMRGSDLLQYLSSNLGLGGNAYDAFSGKRGPVESIINLFKNVSQVKE